MQRTLAWAAVALVPLAALGCDDTEFTASCDSPLYTPDWEGVQVFFDDHCVACHNPIASNPVVLPDDVIASIESGTEPQDDNDPLVAPGDPDASLLWHVISGNLDGVDDYSAMPFGSGPLPDGCTDHVRQWIADGAEISDVSTPDTDAN